MLKKKQPGGFDPIGVPRKTIFQKLKKQGAKANGPKARWRPPVFSIFERLFFSELRSPDTATDCGKYAVYLHCNVKTTGNDILVEISS